MRPKNYSFIKYLLIIIFVVSSCDDGEKKVVMKNGKKYDNTTNSLTLSIYDTSVFYNYNFDRFRGKTVKDFKKTIKEINQSRCEPLIDDFLYMGRICGCIFFFDNGLEIRVAIYKEPEVFTTDRVLMWSKEKGIDNDTIDAIQIVDNSGRYEKTIFPKGMFYDGINVFEYDKDSSDTEFNLLFDHIKKINNSETITLKEFEKFMKHRYTKSKPKDFEDDSIVRGWRYIIRNDYCIDVFFNYYIKVGPKRKIKNSKDKEFINEEIYYIGFFSIKP